MIGNYIEDYFYQSCPKCSLGSELPSEKDKRRGYFLNSETNNSVYVDYKAGDVICTQCGEILQARVVNMNSEINSHWNNDDGKKDSGQRSMGYDNWYEGIVSSTDTVFTPSSSIASSSYSNPNKIKASTSNISQLHRAQKLIGNSKEKMAFRHVHLVHEVCAKLELVGATKEEACRLFVSYAMKKYSIAEKKEIIAATCAFIACRLRGFPRLAEEIGSVTGIDGRQILKTQNDIISACDIQLRVMQSSDICNRLLRRWEIVSNNKLEFSVIRQATEMCSSIEKFEIVSATSIESLVAVVFAVIAYLLQLKNVRLDDVLTSCFIKTVAPVRNVYTRISHAVPLILPESMQGYKSTKLPISFERLFVRVSEEESAVPDAVHAVAVDSEIHAGKRSPSAANISETNILNKRPKS